MNDYSFRRADNNDMMLIFEWANDDAVRSNSFNTDMISLDEHKMWYEKILSDENRHLYIFMINGNDVGKILISITDDKAEIGYSIAKEYRSMNYSKLMISEFKNIVKSDFPNVKKLYAQVKENNIASQKALTGNGFKNKCYVYECDLSKDIVKKIDQKAGGGTVINK